MKRIISLVCATAVCTLFSMQALGATCGAYLGLGVGKSWVKLPKGQLFTPPTGGRASSSFSGLGARGFFGFNLNKYFGLEAGYTHYDRALYSGSFPGQYSALTYYIHTYDFVAKGYFPFGNTGFNLYALGGIARVVESVQFINGGISANSNVAFPANDGTTHGYNNRPIYGLGANYNFGAHFTINAEITQVQKLNSFSNTPYAVPFLDLATVNVAYNFG